MPIDDTFSVPSGNQHVDKLKSIYEQHDTLASALSRGFDMPHAVQIKLSNFYLERESLKNVWKHVLILLGRRKRGENGKAMVAATAVNMQSDETREILLEGSIVETQNSAAIIKVLCSKGIPVADDEVSLFVQMAKQVNTSQKL